MGLVGLGLTARAAAPLFPGSVRAPAYFTELWIGLGVLAFLLLLGLYALKTVLHFTAVRAEFLDPVRLGFCATLPVSMTLVAAGLAPYLAGIADILWWSGVVLLGAFAFWGAWRLVWGAIRREVVLAQVNAGLMILFIGGIVVPAGGIALDHVSMAFGAFAASALAAPAVMAVVLYRAFAAPDLPEPLRPSWFILLVPPSLIYAHGTYFSPESTWLEGLFLVGVALFAALIVYGRRFWHWPFGPSWWAFTFPLDAFAYAAVRYAHAHPSALWKGVAALALLAATFVVAMVLARSLLAARHLFSKRL